MDTSPATQFDFWLGAWDVTWGADGAGTNHVTRILDEKIVQENFDGGIPPRFERCLTLDNVHFDYDQHPVFKGLSLQFDFGSLTTLVGPSGSGKTTIIDLAIGLLRPQRGSTMRFLPSANPRRASSGIMTLCIVVSACQSKGVSTPSRHTRSSAEPDWESTIKPSKIIIRLIRSPRRRGRVAPRGH